MVAPSTTKLYIDGAYVESAATEWVDVLNPVNIQCSSTVLSHAEVEAWAYAGNTRSSITAAANHSG